eukprot:TRINITY_DN282_c0_g2_i1.p1 TRINITY_DN282_c0_g2~~TRINITY_DN282_c0_g2_i1.p1  ORF type:complete len:865 (-),score=381.57 TRINITY_DN282_c0_g2_i1:201-2795(-)
MSQFSVTEVERLMRERQQIRNICVIAHVDHGKTTLCDSLVGAAGLIPNRTIGKRLTTDSLKDEVERGITIKSTGISMYFNLKEEMPFAPEDAASSEFLINLIDSPGHVDFSSEVTAALRVTDGALVVVDCVSGVCVQTETVLRQALLERIKPVLCINKIDRLFLSLKLSPEEMFQKFAAIIEHVNELIDRFTTDETRELMGSLRVTPADGSVTFAAGKMGWGFSVPSLARFYAGKLGKPMESIMKRMWGDRFYCAATRKWTFLPYSEDGSPNERGFCKYALSALARVIATCEALPEGFSTRAADEPLARLSAVLDSIGVAVAAKDREELSSSSDLIRHVLQAWLPAHVPLLESIVCHLPSPVRAQPYRTELLYTGPSDDHAADGIRRCDPDGPLVVYISKLVPPPEGFEKSTRFFAFGRVFSGTLRMGMKVNIMGAAYEHGGTADLFQGKSLQGVCVMMGKKAVGTESICAGNTVALAGIDQFLLKSGTIVSEDVHHPIVNMKFSVSPVVRCAVRPRDAKDLPRLTAGLRRLSKFDSLVQCITSDTGEHLVCAAGELHLEICISNLREIVGEAAPLITSEPVVTYCETVTGCTAEPVFGKSTNKHNRVFIECAPMDQQLVEEVVSGSLSLRTAADERADRLSAFGWSRSDARTKLWAFGPEGSDKAANALVDGTTGVMHLGEVKDSMCAAFHWATREGALCGEELRGARFNIVDARLHQDSVHRASGQILPMVRSVINDCELLSAPRVMQPIFAVDVQCPTEAIAAVYSVLSRRKGEVLSTEPHPLTDTLSTLSGFIPVASSFNFHAELMQATAGRAFPVLRFDHWEVMADDPFDPASPSARVVADIRTRRGLAPLQPAAPPSR